MSVEQSEDYGALQKIVDDLYKDQSADYEVRQLAVVIAAESNDLPPDLMEVVSLLPSASYTRQKLCDQLNSIIGGHAWGQVYGTVE